VIQRAEEQRNVEGIVLELKITSIADVRVECAVASGFLNLSRNGIDQDHVMALLGQGCSVDAGRAPHVQNTRVRRDAGGDQFLDALELQAALSRADG